jgi:hypothetical protein
MESKARLLHKTQMTYLPTTLPANFYGMPSGKVFVVYSRFYEINFDKSGLEYVFAEHEDFEFEYKSNRLFQKYGETNTIPVALELVDKPEPKIRIIKVYRNINSYNEAQKILNEKFLFQKV